MYSSVTYGILIVLLFVLIAIACAMLASHFRPKRPRTEAHHGHPVLDPSSLGGIDPQRKSDASSGPGESAANRQGGTEGGTGGGASGN